MTRPQVWPGSTPDELRRVQQAIDRLTVICDEAGYWTPIGKVVETLVYATEPGSSERAVVDAVLGDT